MPERVVVCNTSPLLYLHQVGQLELLKSLYQRIKIPSAVREELRAGAERGIDIPDLERLSWIDVESLQDTALVPVVVDLGAGEAAAIALALSFPTSLLILDDGLGRRIAGLSHLTFTGTLGVLVKAKQSGLLPEIAPVLEALQSTTMYLSRDLILNILREAGEA
jgi:predicted nucleic acid-binding protein